MPFVVNKDNFNVLDALAHAVINDVYYAEVLSFLIKHGDGLDKEEEKVGDSPPEIGFDYSGHGLDGYGWKPAFDWRKCCAECWLDERCTHWTGVRRWGEGNGCWLKSGQGNKTRKIGATSGTRNCLDFV